MAFHFEIAGAKIVVSMVKNGNMSGQQGKDAWTRKMNFFRAHFANNGCARRLVSTRVCHGTAIQEVGWNSGGIIWNTDGLITRDSRVVLAVNYADCFPVVIWDIVTKMRSVVHVGFQGASREIISLVIARMISLGAKVENIFAFIGPGICQQCYEYGSEALQKIDAKYFHHLEWNGIKEKYAIDISGIIFQQMIESKISIHNIAHCDLCTHEDDRLHSARRQKPDSLEKLQSGVLMVG